VELLLITSSLNFLMTRKIVIEILNNKF